MNSRPTRVTGHIHGQQVYGYAWIVRIIDDGSFSTRLYKVDCQHFYVFDQDLAYHGSILVLSRKKNPSWKWYFLKLVEEYYGMFLPVKLTELTLYRFFNCFFDEAEELCCYLDRGKRMLC